MFEKSLLNNSFPVDDFTSLVIKNVKFTHLPNKLSEFMPNLESIIVENTGFEVIGSEVLSNLTNLRTLKITKNKLSVLSPEMFQDILKITHMDFTDNDFNIIDSDTFKNLTNLEFLSLRSKGCFRNIPDNGHAQTIKQRNVKSNCHAWSKEDDHKTHLSKISPPSKDDKIYTPVY